MTPTLPNYTITRLLGQGGMAEVYAGLDPELDRPVAVKLIHPRLAVDSSFEERFRREARLVAGLRHPHIVQVYDYLVTDDGPVMVMEFLPGGSLKDRLDDLRARGERLPLTEAAAIVDALASALDYAHRNGAVHRDVKPANVLFDREGAPVLADFGIARILDDESGLTQPGSIIGTPAYLSPEQAAGEAAGPASDLYSLGIVLYELVTGTPPFQGTTTAILAGHATSPPPPASQRVAGLPAAVDAVLQKALAKRPQERYASGAALAQALRAAIPATDGATPPLTEQPTVVERAPSPSPQASPPPTVQPPTTQPPTTQPPATSDPLARLADRLDVLSPLVGHSIPAAYRDGRSRLASTLGLIGLLFAILQFAADFLDLAEKAWRPIGLALQSLPLLVGLLLLTGAGLALFSLRRPNRMLNRRRAIGLAAALALAALLWSGWTVAGWLRPPDKLIVAIGEFERFSSRVGNPAGDLFLAMERAFAGLDEKVSVQRTWRTYASAGEAKADGAARGAVALLWGSYSDDGVTVYLEAIAPPPQAEIGGVSLSLQKFSGLAERMGIGRAAPSTQLSRFERDPFYIPDRVSFAASETEHLTAAAAAVLGLSFQLAGDSDTARRLYDQAIADLSGDDGLVGAGTVYFQRGVLRWQEGKSDGAIVDMEQAVALAPDDYQARYNLAVFYASGCATPERIAQAIAQAEAAARLRPDDESHRNLLASLYVQAGRKADALALLAGPDAPRPQSAEDYLFLAQMYTGLGEANAAQAAVTEGLALLEKQSDDSTAHRLTLGRAYILAGRYKEALALFQQVTESEPTNPEGWRGVGDAHFWLDELTEAQNAYTRLAELSPEAADGYLLLGLTAAARQEQSAALEALVQAARRDACDPTANLLLGGQYILDGKYAEAIPALRNALVIDPENVSSLYLLGSALVYQGDWAGAEAAYAKAAALRPDDPAILHGLAQSLSAQGKAAESEQPWRRYVALVPEETDGWHYLALALLYQGKNGEAEEAARQGLAAGDDPDLLVSLGMALEGQGKDSAAADAFRQALGLEPENAGAHRGLGEIARRSGALEEAIAAFAEAARLSGAATDYTALAALYQQTGSIALGREAVAVALAAEPENGDALVRAGLLARDGGAPAEAEGYFQQAAALRPEDPLPLLGLVQVAYQQCRLSSAAQAAQRIVEVSPAPFFQGMLASIYLAQGRAAEAEAIVAALQASPATDSEAHAAAARLLLRQDRLAEALAALQLALEATPPGSLNASLLPLELGSLYLLLDQPLPAAGELERALALRPELIPAQAGLGDVALWQGDATGAVEMYAAALEKSPRYRSLTDQENFDTFRAITQAKLALALEQAGQQEAAAKEKAGARSLAEGLTSATPRNPLAHFTLATIHLLAGETDAAERAFAQAIQCDASLAPAQAQVERVVAGFRE